MSEEMLIMHCSPTLAGMKAGSLFSYKYESKREVTESLRNLNVRLSEKGLRILPLCASGGRVLIYVYRPGQLRKYFCADCVKEILKELGYTVEDSEKCITALRKRLHESSGFPHEIGLFLGYPPEDVRGFIENHAENYKDSGLWKVYGDADAAEKLFAKYKKCTDVYFDRWRDGYTLEKLTVAV